MNEPRFRGLPMVLETPYADGSDGYKREIALIEPLVERKKS